MGTHPTDPGGRESARVHDEEPPGTARRAPARSSSDDVTALPPGQDVPPAPRGRTGRRAIVIGAVAATATAAAGVIVLTGHLGGSTDSARLAAAVEIKRGTTSHEARIVDPHADVKRFKAAFAAYGLHVTVRLLPVSPRLVGTVVFRDEDERAQRSESEGAGITMIHDPACRTASGGSCPIGLRVPLRFEGRADISIGRKAEPGERYASTSPADAARGLEGMTVAQAEAALARRGLRVGRYNVYWPQWGTSLPRTRIPSRWKVSDDDADPYSPGTVLLAIDAQGPMPPDVADQARRNWNR